MIAVTGAAGFIGSCLVGELNRQGLDELVLVDRFDRDDRRAYYEDKTYRELVERDAFPEWLEKNGGEVEFVYHIGARTDTAEFDDQLLDRLNTSYTKAIWKLCAVHDIPLVYASSAATYGLGEHGYRDEDELAFKLKPLNPYGHSKNEFDKWALRQKECPPSWKGVKFFNVYGPNEYHKGRMASVVFHTYKQVKETGKMKLFRSHNPDFRDGEQKRDFIYVRDVTDVLAWMYGHREGNGLYNLGTGRARTFLDLARATFKAMDVEENIEFIDTPEDIRDKYQYFTQAEMGKIRNLGYDGEFTSLEEGVRDYVRTYLESSDIL